jgi:hypothetical protein
MDHRLHALLQVLNMFSSEIISRQELSFLVADLFNRAPDLMQQFNQWVPCPKPTHAVPCCCCCGTMTVHAGAALAVLRLLAPSVLQVCGRLRGVGHL